MFQVGVFEKVLSIPVEQYEINCHLELDSVKKCDFESFSSIISLKFHLKVYQQYEIYNLLHIFVNCKCLSKCGIFTFLFAFLGTLSISRRPIKP